MTARITLAGSTGRVGRALVEAILVEAILAPGDLALAGFVGLRRGLDAVMDEA